MGIFRELFVEVPLAVLEAAAKAKLEEQKPKINLTASASPPRDIWMMTLDAIVKWRDFPWRFVEVRKDERFERVHVIVELPCLHLGRFSLDESDSALYGRPIDVFDHILEQLEGRPRRKCYCVQQEDLKPCCVRGECKVGGM